MTEPLAYICSFRFRLPLIITIIGVLISCSEEEMAEHPVKITLAAEMSLLPATVWVAESEGFFKNHKVELEIREFDSG